MVDAIMQAAKERDNTSVGRTRAEDVVWVYCFSFCLLLVISFRIADTRCLKLIWMSTLMKRRSL